MMIHQNGSTHEWVVGEHWDLIVTMDDATFEHYSMIFVAEEGTQSSFQGVEARIRFAASSVSAIEVISASLSRQLSADSSIC